MASPVPGSLVPRLLVHSQLEAAIGVLELEGAPLLSPARVGRNALIWTQAPWSSFNRRGSKCFCPVAPAAASAARVRSWGGSPQPAADYSTPGFSE